LKIFL